MDRSQVRIAALYGFLSREFRRLRADRGWTAEELAARASTPRVPCSRMFVVNLETRPIPASLRRFLRLCNALLVRHDDLESLAEKSLQSDLPGAVWAAELRSRRTLLLGATRRELAFLPYLDSRVATEDYIRRIERQGPGLTVLRTLNVARRLGLRLCVLQEGEHLEDRLRIGHASGLGPSDIKGLAEIGRLTEAWSLAWDLVCSTIEDTKHAHSRAILIASIVAAYAHFDGWGQLLAHASRRLEPEDRELLGQIIISCMLRDHRFEDWEAGLKLAHEYGHIFDDARPSESRLFRQQCARSLSGIGRHEEALTHLPDPSVLSSNSVDPSDITSCGATLTDVLVKLGRTEEASRILEKIDYALSRLKSTGTQLNKSRSLWLADFAPRVFALGNARLGRAMSEMAKQDAPGEYAPYGSLKRTLAEHEYERGKEDVVTSAERRALARRVYALTIEIKHFRRVAAICRPLLEAHAFPESDFGRKGRFLSRQSDSRGPK